MKRKILKKVIIITCSILITLSVVGCSSNQDTTSTSTSTTSESTTVASSTTGNVVLDAAELLSERDLEQSPDLSDATSIELTSGEDVSITDAGIYVISGNAENATIIVEAADDAKIQIVLDGASITNEDAPAIYVKTGDKVFVTTTDSENTLEVTGTYESDGETNLDAVIFSSSDLTLNGTGSLEIISEQGNGISSKDDLNITGGTYIITATGDGLEANDSIVIYYGTLTIDAGQDALHSENEEDTALGYIYIINGTLNIKAGDDGIRGTSIIQIDGGTIYIESSVEGIEGTYIVINGGTIDLYASNDGINATNKSTAYDVAIEVNGGTLTLEIGSGDTDAFDSNGDIYVNGGEISITATSPFDFDATGELNGGTVTVNGSAYTEMTESMPGGGGQMGGGGPGMR